MHLRENGNCNCFSQRIINMYLCRVFLPIDSKLFLGQRISKYELIGGWCEKHG